MAQHQTLWTLHLKVQILALVGSLSTLPYPPSHSFFPPPPPHTTIKILSTSKLLRKSDILFWSTQIVEEIKSCKAYEPFKSHFEQVQQVQQWKFWVNTYNFSQHSPAGLICKPDLPRIKSETRLLSSLCAFCAASLLLNRPICRPTNKMISCIICLKFQWLNG